MTSWLWQSAIWLSALAAIILVSHPLLLRNLGARTCYSLWLLLPSALILPLLPNITSNHNLPLVQQWLVTPGTIDTLSSQANASYVYAIWIAGFCSVVAWCAFSYQQLKRYLKSGHFFKLGKLRCYRHDKSGPAIFGFFQPTLLLPNDFKQRFTKAERHLILQHERAHWQAGDLHTNLVALLLLAIFWFSPLAWLAYRRFRADQELACDARVIEQQNPHTLVCYANALLAAMQSVHSAAHTNFLSPHYGATKHMTERLSHLTIQKGYYKQPLIMGLSILILLAMLLQPSTATQATEPEVHTENIAKPIVRIEPRYPVTAAQQGITGWVTLGFTIDSNGMVTQPKVLAAHPEGIFDEEALRAVSRWRYSPHDAGKSITIQLQFALDTQSN